MAPRVTHSEATIIGKIPNLPISGCHSEEKRNPFSPYRNMNGKPSLMIKSAIRRRAERAEKAIPSRMTRTPFSPISFMGKFYSMEFSFIGLT
jgi:hypothetical protein